MVAAPISESAVQLTDVFQHVGSHCALDGVSLRVQCGEVLLLVGPNGAGKTLLTRLMAGLDRPSAGAVRLFGQDLAELDEAAMTALRRRVGVVMQRGSLLDGLTVLENLLLPLRTLPMDREAMARAARLVMTQLLLDGMENHQPRSLSLGQRRRVELARALIHQPRLLLWDGLTDGLDPASVRDIFAILRLQQELRGLAVIATDNGVMQGLGESARIVVLDRGRILFEGDQDTLRQALPERIDLRYVIEGNPG
ncbi:ATP-binding cassette domain-containing protein [Thiohalocapsa marina]|uniref:ATP-binding cassette domain-containing protein n=1 Tax=Thiohalocapsa marina TaxID=424902 RepID=A0A5M8FPY6_9GAMM|nr:ATP-binding cassette domain-containing protein [Thiohalocapsa marina]